MDASQATPPVTNTAPIHPNGSSAVPSPTAPSVATISTSDFEYTVPIAKSRILNEASSANVPMI